MRHFYRSIPGWFDFQDVYAEMVRDAQDGAHFVEVGGRLGRSTAFLAVEVLNSGKRIRLDAVDHWNGNANEQWMLDFVARIGGSAWSAFEDNLREVLHLIHVAEGDPADAAARHAEGSLDFVFLDAGDQYDAVRGGVRAWLPKVKRGGALGVRAYSGPTSPEVDLAVHDLIGLTEVVRRDNGVEGCGGSWLWRKDCPLRGYWHVRPPQPTGDYFIGLPFVNRPDLLADAVASLHLHWPRAAVIDQSADGLEDVWGGSLPVFRWTGPRRFTVVQNWMQREAERRGCRFLLFMHSDASCAPAAVGKLLEFARTQQGKWGVVFTNYDSLCCFNMEAVRDVGCWDETFSWYVSDIDYYNRMKWRGWETRQCPDLDVAHHTSQTVQSMGEAERAAVHRETGWAEAHYEHKWGGTWHQGAGRPERFRIPYDGRP